MNTRANIYDLTIAVNRQLAEEAKHDIKVNPIADPFIIVSGGTVQNNPLNIVFDFDILDDLNPKDTEGIHEIQTLYNKLIAFVNLYPIYYDELKEWIDACLEKLADIDPDLVGPLLQVNH